MQHQSLHQYVFGTWHVHVMIAMGENVITEQYKTYGFPTADGEPTLPNDTSPESPPSSECTTTQPQHIAVETLVSDLQPTEEHKMIEFVMKELQASY